MHSNFASPDLTFNQTPLQMDLLVYMFTYSYSYHYLQITLFSNAYDLKLISEYYRVQTTK